MGYVSSTNLNMAVELFHLLVYCFILVVVCHGGSDTDVNYDEEWTIEHQKGIMKRQSLIIKRVKHPTNSFNSCYRITCSGAHCPPHNTTDNPIEVCYPGIIITGLPKCGTSAMYDLLSRLPNAKLMAEKENCPYVKRRAHWIYFRSLPSLKSIEANDIIIDGCIDVLMNMKMREVLRNPVTYYLVMIRDYADMLWSSYNFWCKREYDGFSCVNEKYTIPGLHHRSPETFHELIVKDQNNSVVVQPFYYPMHRPCINGGGYYIEYLDFHFKRINLLNYTVVIAAEELEINPLHVIQRVLHIFPLNMTEIIEKYISSPVDRMEMLELLKHIPLNYPVTTTTSTTSITTTETTITSTTVTTTTTITPRYDLQASLYNHSIYNKHEMLLWKKLLNISDFQSIRVNPQEKKGSRTHVDIRQYQPGLYNISGYRPMLPETRTLLNQCWRDDCMQIAKRYNYKYKACMDVTSNVPNQGSSLDITREMSQDSIAQHANERLVLSNI